MSPPRRRSTYRPPRNRREVAIAVLSSLAIVVVTATLIWVLRPNKDSGSTGTTTTTTPAITTPAPTTVVPTTVAPGDTTAPAGTTPTS